MFIDSKKVINRKSCFQLIRDFITLAILDRKSILNSNIHGGTFRLVQKSAKHRKFEVTIHFT